MAIYAGAGTRIPRPTHVVPLHSFIRTSLATCSSAAVSDSRWRRFVGCSYAGRERGACQVQSAASRRLASPRTGRWCGRRDRVRAWPSRRARAGNFASPVMRFAAARSPGNFASPVMRFAAARPRCFVRPDRLVTPTSGQFTRQNEDIARPRRRHWLPAGVGKRVAGESATAEAPLKASYLRGHRSRVLDVASSRPQQCRAACR